LSLTIPKESRISNNPKAHLVHEVTPKFEETNKTKTKIENMQLKFEYMLVEAKMNTIYIYKKYLQEARKKKSEMGEMTKKVSRRRRFQNGLKAK
jgi:hypothetical protein